MATGNEQVVVVPAKAQVRLRGAATTKNQAESAYKGLLVIVAEAMGLDGDPVAFDMDTGEIVCVPFETEPEDEPTE